MPPLSPPSGIASRLRPVAAGHPAVRRFLASRRNLLPRQDQVIAVSGLWAHRRVVELDGVVELLLWCPACCRAARSDQGHVPPSELLDRLAGRAEAAFEISERTADRLDPGRASAGLFSLVRIPGWDRATLLTEPGMRLVLVADGIEYAGNLGALLRGADASGADAVLLTNPVARLTHPAVFSASRGTVLTTPTATFEDVAAARRELRSAGFDVVVSDPAADAELAELRRPRTRLALVVGSEGCGVAPEWRDPALTRVSIAMRGRADSLNVATAAAILLYAAAGSIDGGDPADDAPRLGC